MKGALPPKSASVSLSLWLFIALGLSMSLCLPVSESPASPASPCSLMGWPISTGGTTSPGNYRLWEEGCQIKSRMPS